MPDVKPGTSTACDKQRIPKVIHPLATPGYVIIFKFITSCVLNILGFVLIYTFLFIALPISLLAKVVQKILVFVRIKSQGAKADYGNASETFWFLTASEDRTPNLILLLAVKGHFSCEDLGYLLQNRLNCNGENILQERSNFERLSRSPKRIFRKLVWLEDNLERRKAIIQGDLESACLCDAGGKTMNLQAFSNSNDWQIYLYTSVNENTTDNSAIVLQFRHCIADLHTLVYAVSKSFLDHQVFMFREEITSTQGFCLGLLALLAGPSIFVRSLFESKDMTFLEPPQTCRKRAIFYSQAISRADVDIVTTATGTSVCDVILSCLAGSLRCCLKQHGVAFPDDVTVFYPMNLESSNSLRCFTSFNIFSLPVGTEGALPRLWEMRLRRSNIASFIEAITTSTIMQLAFLILPASAATWLMEYLMSKSSCTINSILGHTFDQEILLDGRPVEHFIPVEDRGYGLSITIIESKNSFQLAVLAPSSENYVIKPARLCVEFVRHTRDLSKRLTERARVVRARGQRILNSRRNSVFIVEEDEQ
ncbi:uncharacterized protein LOC114521082 [Dendronephthya gigantea]|uniref:uncharacterized protein LOC114521082 n=1 Tax=Dendronephthya gigantea TaxID=151771 RepID=UPI001068EBA8|nr:uncharacterized protein LOC114521082 [Dendronephthya gigantea]